MGGKMEAEEKVDKTLSTCDSAEIKEKTHAKMVPAKGLVMSLLEPKKVGTLYEVFMALKERER